MRSATARCWPGGTVNAKQLTELQHELETLERRQASLEDSLLEVMERREELQATGTELARIDELQSELSEAQQARDDARTNSTSRHQSRSRRDDLVAGIGRRSGRALRAPAGPRRAWAPALLQGRRCGACRIEIDRGELARITRGRRTMCCAAPSAGQSCCGVKGIRREGRHRGRRRVAGQPGPGRLRRGGVAADHDTSSPSASRRSAGPPTTSPSTAA